MAQQTTLTALEVGGEGGSIRLVCRHGISALQYAVLSSETFLDVEPTDPTEPVVEWHHSWEAALATLDRYPWALLTPIQIHPLFHVPVLAAVAPRLIQDGHWNEHHWNYWLDCVNGTFDGPGRSDGDNISETGKVSETDKPCDGDRIQWFFPSRLDPISNDQAELVSDCIEDLNAALLAEFDVRSVADADANAFRRIFEIREYKRFARALYACGFVTHDTDCVFPLDAANASPKAVLGACRFEDIRHYLHTLSRDERWSDAYSSPIFEAMRSGALQLVGERLRKDPILR